MSQTNAERFLNAYASIEESMNRITQAYHYRTFSVLLSECAKRNRIVRNNMENLREYNELRNAIVHQRDNDMEIIAEPSDRVTSDIKHIAAMLTEHHEVLEYAGKPVQTLTPEERIEDAYQKMAELDTSKMPVYYGHQYKGLLTMEAIAHWGLYRDAEDTAAAVMSRGQNADRVIFVPRTESLDAVLKRFEKAMSEGHKPPAVIITEHGNNTEKPLGIVTTQDLPKILDSLMK